ncbi:MAG: hypothetical protein PWQ11_171, partial [Candidatus Diapherotrites archaeon]|nr:hypothetical protein [Candidatus Diapherotrites archaeon]
LHKHVEGHLVVAGGVGPDDTLIEDFSVPAALVEETEEFVLLLSKGVVVGAEGVGMYHRSGGFCRFKGHVQKVVGKDGGGHEDTVGLMGEAGGNDFANVAKDRDDLTFCFVQTYVLHKVLICVRIQLNGVCTYIRLETVYYEGERSYTGEESCYELAGTDLLSNPVPLVGEAGGEVHLSHLETEPHVELFMFRDEVRLAGNNLHGLNAEDTLVGAHLRGNGSDVGVDPEYGLAYLFSKIPELLGNTDHGDMAYDIEGLRYLLDRFVGQELAEGILERAGLPLAFRELRIHTLKALGAARDGKDDVITVADGAVVAEKQPHGLELTAHRFCLAAWNTNAEHKTNCKKALLTPGVCL